MEDYSSRRVIAICETGPVGFIEWMCSPLFCSTDMERWNAVHLGFKAYGWSNLGKTREESRIKRYP